MGRIIKAILVLVTLAVGGLTGFAYLGNFAPDATEISKPVTLNVD